MPAPGRTRSLFLPASALALALVAVLATPPRAAAPVADHNAHTFTNPVARRWWATVTALAYDAMRGRQTGSPEHLQAAHLMADRFKALGLKPGGADGSYLQPVAFTARRVRESECSLTLAFADHDDRLVLGEDATLQMSIASADTIDVPAVFVGYGLSVPEQKFDEIGGADLKGKIAVYITGTPKGVTEPRRAQAKSAEARLTAMKPAA